MFKENEKHPHYLGLVKKVFDDMQKYSRLITLDKQRSFIRFQVKLFDMKFFLDSAILHVKAAIKRQALDISSSQELLDREKEWKSHRLPFQPARIPSLDELNLALGVLVDLEE